MYTLFPDFGWEHLRLAGAARGVGSAESGSDVVIQINDKGFTSGEVQNPAYRSAVFLVSSYPFLVIRGKVYP